MTIQDSSKVSVLARFATVGTWLLASLPWLFLLTVSLAAAEIRRALGYWPAQAIETYPNALADGLMFIAMMIFIVLFVAWAFGFLFWCFKRPVRAIFQTALFAIGYLSIFYALDYLPYEYTTWFMD